MRRLTYIYAILFIMAIVFVVVNCTDEDLVKNGQENMEEFSIQEAKDYSSADGREFNIESFFKL